MTGAGGLMFSPVWKTGYSSKPSFGGESVFPVDTILPVPLQDGIWTVES
jgi:hypothetical protein